MVQFVKYLIGIVLFSAFIVCRDPQGSWKDNTNWDTLIFPVRTGTLAYSRIVNNNEKKPVLSYQQPEKDAVSIATGANNLISSVSRQSTVSSTKPVPKSLEKQQHNLQRRIRSYFSLCLNRSIVIPPRRLSSFPQRIPPVMDRGIVFYVYSYNGCFNTPRYLNETLRNAQFIKKLDSMVEFNSSFHF